MSLLQRFAVILLLPLLSACSSEASPDAAETDPAAGQSTENGAETGNESETGEEGTGNDEAEEKVAEPQWETWFAEGTRDDWYQTGNANFQINDGTLTGSARNLPRNSFFATRKFYGDFELEVEVKIAPGGNSGIQVRSELDESADRIIGYQIEIDTSERAWSGGLFEEGKRGWLNDLKDNEAGRAAFKNGEWNHYRIVCKGDHIQSWVNGVQCADHHDDAAAEGRVAFQVHGGKSADVEWRNARIREIKN